jgi:hypothetical protein
MRGTDVENHLAQTQLMVYRIFCTIASYVNISHLRSNNSKSLKCGSDSIKYELTSSLKRTIEVECTIKEIFR